MGTPWHSVDSKTEMNDGKQYSMEAHLGFTRTHRTARGLSSEQAAKTLAADGPNTLDPSSQESFFVILLTQMRSVLFLLTLIASALFCCMGEYPKGAGMVLMVAFVCLVNTIGEYTGHDAGGALLLMSTSRARALRDGEEVEVDARDLVVGDVVMLQMGDVVPADMVVLDSCDLQTNESVLTGEPHEILKTLEPRDKDAPFLSNMLYKMTSVVGGYGEGEVVATGMRTQVGLIAKRLQHDKNATVLSPMQKSLNVLGSMIAASVSAAAFVITVVGFCRGYEDARRPCTPGDIGCRLASNLLNGIMMPVALVPHGLPFVVTVMLRLSRREMSHRNAIITKSTAVDYLSATTVICTDKTGTLTEGTMTAQVAVGLCCKDPAERLSESLLTFYPLKGLSPNGGLFTGRALTDEAKLRMDAKFDPDQRRQVFAEPGLIDWADPEGNWTADSVDYLMARAHLGCGYLNCHNTHLLRDPDTGSWKTKGNMTEGAIKVAAAKGGLMDGDAMADRLKSACPRLPELEVPFNPKRKMMASVHQLTTGQHLETLKFGPEVTHVALLKGAPEKLVPLVSNAVDLGSECLQVPGRELTSTDLDRLEHINRSMASSSLRSLLLSVSPLTPKDIQRLMQASNADERIAIIISTSLCFLSLWGIYDPPRAEVKPSVQECHQAGIRVVMITGDHINTAKSIAEQVGIVSREDRNFNDRVSTCAAMHHARAPIIPLRGTKNLSEKALNRLRSSFDGSLDKKLDQHKKSVHIESASVISSPTTLTTIGTHTSSGDSSESVKSKWILATRKVNMQLATLRALRPSSVNSSIHSGRGENDEHEPVYKSEQELVLLTSRINVWARAQPTDKVAIVESLASEGHIAAMTGDGVNDAPALRSAAVGVSMGISGTEVTKNVADLILMDDNFSTIVQAIREGRRIYMNTQKYVLCNMSLKFGEGMLNLCAIALGIPLPITALQQMMNMPITHSACTMPFAWEAEEVYVMKVPPRKAAEDSVVPRMMWIWRCAPFVFCFTVVVLTHDYISIRAHTGSGFTERLIATDVPGLVERGLKSCERAGSVRDDGVFQPHRCNFHCRCIVHKGGFVWNEATEVHQWGTTESTAASEFDPWTGDTGTVFWQDRTEWKNGKNGIVEECPDKFGKKHWCWTKELRDTEPKPVIPEGVDCVSAGHKLGQTMAYVTLQLGEILSVLTYRMDGFCVPRMFSNPVYLLALFGNVVMLLTVVYLPLAQRILDFAPLVWNKFAYSSALALGLVCLNEICKVAYRRRLASHNEMLLQQVSLNAFSVPAVTKPPPGESELVDLRYLSSPRRNRTSSSGTSHRGSLAEVLIRSPRNRPMTRQDEFHMGGDVK